MYTNRTARTARQVSKASTAKLVEELGASFNSWLSEHQHLDTPDALKHKITAEPVKNLSANVFVQCMRQVCVCVSGEVGRESV